MRAINTLMIFLLVLTGCGDNKTAPYCGALPPHPGVAVAFEGDNAIMSRADYLALTDYQDELAAIAECLGAR